VAAEERFRVPASERPYHITGRIIRRVICKASTHTRWTGSSAGARNRLRSLLVNHRQ
jgi:hypothetical protein